MLLKKIRENTFLFVAFALGWASLYGNVLNFLLILLLIVNVWGNGAEFWRNVRQEKYYLGIPVFFLIYMVFHALFYRTGAESGLKPSYGIFETLTLYFILVPLYLLSMKPWMSVKMLEKALRSVAGKCLYGFRAHRVGLFQASAGFAGIYISVPFRRKQKSAGRPFDA